MHIYMRKLTRNTHIHTHARLIDLSPVIRRQRATYGPASVRASTSLRTNDLKRNKVSNSG